MRGRVPPGRRVDHDADRADGGRRRVALLPVVAAAASGFLVQQSNWLITNYHAVTEVVFAPDEHELGVVTHDQQRIAAQVIAVDVRHDLALLQLQTPLRAPVLALREQWPAKGEAGYSMGKPGHYQHSIVSGTFNGVIDETTTPQLVFSGAINPGMSGGPTLDTQGRVVGINVASSTENQLLGLAVPERIQASDWLNRQFQVLLVLLLLQNS